MELIQWMKRYYDVNCGGRGENYPAEERRGFIEPDFSFCEKTVTPKTYNGSGETTYSNNNTLLKPAKKEEVSKKATSSGYGAPSSNYHNTPNIPQTNYAPKLPNTKSASDHKLKAIRDILGMEISND